MVSVKNLTKRYSSGTLALDDISFEINRSEICGYIGTNGAGKSTTVKILTGILEFDEGEASVSNINVKKNPFEVKKVVGYVPETSNLFNSLSPIEFLEFVGKVRDIDPGIIRKRTCNFAELFDFKDFLSESIGNLSNGNKQKILITSALLHNPEVIFFDEPLNGLDSNAIFTFQELVKYLVSKSKTIFYCSHLLGTVEKISTKIILLDKGKKILDTKTSELRNSKDYVDLESLFQDLKFDGETRKFSYEGLFD